MIEDRQVGLGAAAFRQLADGDHRGAVELGHRVVAHVREGGAGRSLGHLDLVVQTDALDGRLGRQGHAAPVGTGDEAQGLEVDQQRIRAHQEGLVVVAAVVVERRQLRVDEAAAVQHQITGDLQHAVGAQVAHHQPQLLHVQLRVSTTLEIEVAVEHPVLERAVGIELGLPLVGGTQQLQGCIGGDQLHGGGRVHRHVRVEDGLGTRAGQRQGHQRQRGGRDLVLLQGLLDLRCEGRVDLDGLGRQGEGQEQAGEGERAKGLEQGHQRRSSGWRWTTGACMARCSHGGLGKMRALCRKQPPGAGAHAARAKRRRTC